MNMRGRQFRTGVTLLESLLAAVVLAMASAAIIVPFSAGALSTSEEARQTVAVNLAQDLVEEILAKPFGDPDVKWGKEPNPGQDDEERREDWDDMDDYDGFSESAGQITSFNGSVVTDPAAAIMTRHCWVKGVYVAGQDTSENPTFLQIIVEVRYRGDTLVKLSRLVYANEQGERR